MEVQEAGSSQNANKFIFGCGILVILECTMVLDSLIPGFCVSGFWGFLGLFFGFLGFWEFLGFWVAVIFGFWIPWFLVFWFQVPGVLGFCVARFPGCLVSSCLGFWFLVSGCLGSWFRVSSCCFPCCLVCWVAGSCRSLVFLISGLLSFLAFGLLNLRAVFVSEMLWDVLRPVSLAAWFLWSSSGWLLTVFSSALEKERQMMTFWGQLCLYSI